MQEVFSRTLDYTAGLTGSTMIYGTSAITGAFQSFIVNADAVIAAALDKDGNDIVSQFGAQTLNQGAYWVMPKGNYLKSITLSSGSIIAYNI
jgi:hypothetical protein